MRIPFPKYGLVEGAASIEQPNETSFSLQNVRPYDVTKEKARGGQRPALVKWSDTNMVNPIIGISQVTTTYITPSEA